MKKFCIILSALLIFSGVKAQSCLPEGIIFENQAQINSFQTNYPGCTAIEGNVIISGENINNLNGLSVLTSITGDLEINYNYNLYNLTGLDSLADIGGNLSLQFNPLTTLTGLESLTSIGGDLSIIENPNLLNLSGLANLSANSISNLSICNNYSLSDCEVQGICDYLSDPGGTINVRRNDYGCRSVVELANACGGSMPCLPYGNYYFVQQSDIDNFHSAFPDCTDLEGGVTIISGSEISNLNGLNMLTSIHGGLDISYNDALSNLEGLEGLNSLTGDLTIYGNNALTGLSGLRNIEAGTVYNLTIIGNSSMTDCEAEFICDYLASPNGFIDIFLNANGCNSVVEVADSCGISLPCLPSGNYWFFTQADIDSFQVNYPGCVNIQGNVNIDGIDITNLNGLNLLESVSGDLRIYCALTSISGLDNLDSVGGDFIIANGGLVSLTALNDLNYVGGSLVIDGLYALTSLTGLEGLTSIGGLGIGYNDALTSLNGLNNIEFITGDLWMYNNISITDLSGLEGLMSIGGGLSIGGNAALTTLTGLEGLMSIGGGLSIGGNAALTSLTGLESLTSIGDYFQIYGNDALNNLSGLENLASIGSDLDIYFNNALTGLTGLEGLNFIGGRLYIYENWFLTSLAGIENLNAGSVTDLTITRNFSLSACETQWLCDYISNPGGSIDIYYNAGGCSSVIEIASACGGSMPCLPYGNYYFNSQADIDNFQSAFQDCTELEGNVTINGYDITNLTGLEEVNSIGGDLLIYNTWPLTDLTGLDGLNAIDGNLIIGSFDGCNFLLTSLTGLENLTFIGGSVEILNNISLDNLTGMEGLTSIGEYLSIYNNDSLVSLTGLNNLSFIGQYLSIYYNESLASLTGLENLASIGHNLSIHDNYSLAILTGLENLAFIGFDLEIYNNPSLTSLTGLDGLNTINGNLVIGSEENGGNPSLINLTGLQSLTSIGGSVEITNNETLTSLTGLEGLTSTMDQIMILSNASLTSLAGLDNLTSIGDHLQISYNPELYSLTGLDNVYSIGGKLEILGNHSLTSLTGLDNIDEGSITDLFIYFNSSLSDCAVQSICDYLASPNGTFSFHSNATGCDSEEEVEEACWAGVPGESSVVSRQLSVVSYPNPFSDFTNFEYNLAHSAHVNLSVYDHLGQQVAVLVEGEQAAGRQQVRWDVEGLPAGIYFFRLIVNGQQSDIGKLVIK